MAATRGVRHMSATAAQEAVTPLPTIDRLSGRVTDVTRDGPRQRGDGSNYWIERYVVERADGSAERCDRFVDSDDEPLLGQPGSEVDIKIRRRGEFINIVSEDFDSVIETTLLAKVLAIDREGPLLSARGNEWFVDWYTVESDGVEHRIRKPVFNADDGNLCSVGDEVEFKVKQRGTFPADIMGLVSPDEETVQGKLMSVRTVGPKVSASGQEYTLEFYTIETKPGVTCTASRFLRDTDQPCLAEEGQSVRTVIRNTPKGYKNLISLSTI